MALIDWGAIVQPRWSCTTLSNTAVTMKPGGAIIDLLGTASIGQLISPGAWRRVQILLRQVCCIAACQRVCLSTLPDEQERLSSDKHGTASLVEVVLRTWAGRRQLSTNHTYLLTYLLTHP